MLSRPEFHRLWPPILLLFQLFGLTTYSQPASSGSLLAVRLFVTTISFAFALALCSYTLLCVLTIHEANQINVMSDQLVYMFALPAHLVGLLEALLKQRQSERLFDELYEIYAAIGCGAASKRNVGDTDLLDLRAAQRRLLVRNWLQVTLLFVSMALSIVLTGVQSWAYFRWIVSAQMFISVRLMEVAMHVELLAAALGALERFLLDGIGNSEDRDDEDYRRMTEAAAEIYGRCYAQAAAISRAFGWSLLAMSLYALDGMVNNTFWFVYAMYSGAVKMYAKNYGYDQVAMLVFYAVVMSRLFGACEACSTQRTRCAVALFGQRHAATGLDIHRMASSSSPSTCSAAVRTFGWQLLHEPIRVTVMGGVLVLDYPLFGAMLSIVVTYTVILMQFQQDEGSFNVLDDLY